MGTAFPVHPQELIWPHRLDVLARVEALRLHERLGKTAGEGASYADLVTLLGGDGAAATKVLISTAARVRREPDAVMPLPVRDVRGVHVAYMPGSDVPTIAVPSRYEFVGDADVLAALLAADLPVLIRVVKSDHTAIDFTSFMQLHRLTVADQVMALMPQFPIRPVVPESDSEHISTLLAQIAQYERRVSAIFGALGKPQLPAATTRRNETLAVRARRGLVRPARQLYARLAERRRPPVLTASAGKQQAGTAANQERVQAEARAKEGLFSDENYHKRAKQQRDFAASGEVARLEKLRGIHQGERCFILGNGPSLKLQDLTKLADEQVFVTNWFANHPDFSSIRPNYYCISSHEVFGGWSHKEVKLNEGMRAALEEACADVHPVFFFSYAFRDYITETKLLPGSEKYFLLFDRPKSLVSEKGAVNLNLAEHMDDGMTGIMTFALPLARFMGFKEIYLMGVDSDYGITTPSSPKAYFYDSAQHTTSTTSFDGLQRAWAEGGPVFQAYEIFRRTFAAEGISITNLTPGGRLDVFPRAAYEDVVS